MLITAGTVVTGAEILRPGWIEVVGERVVRVGSGNPPTPPDLALGEVTIVPGFVDMHVHGGGGGAFPTGDPDDARRAIEMHRRHGTTTTVASLVTASPAELIRQVAVMADLTEQGLIVGSHLEGPWLSGDRGGAHELSQLRDPDPVELSAVFGAGRGTIRMVTLAPERRGGLDAVRRVVDGGCDRGGWAHRCDLRPGTCGHRRRRHRRDPPVQRDAAGAPPRAGSGHCPARGPEGDRGVDHRRGTPAPGAVPGRFLRRRPGPGGPGHRRDGRGRDARRGLPVGCARGHRLGGRCPADRLGHDCRQHRDHGSHFPVCPAAQRFAARCRRCWPPSGRPR